MALWDTSVLAVVKLLVHLIDENGAGGRLEESQLCGTSAEAVPFALNDLQMRVQRLGLSRQGVLLYAHFPTKLPTNDDIGPFALHCRGRRALFLLSKSWPRAALEERAKMPARVEQHMQIRGDESCPAALGRALED